MGWVDTELVWHWAGWLLAGLALGRVGIALVWRCAGLALGRVGTGLGWLWASLALGQVDLGLHWHWARLPLGTRPGWCWALGQVGVGH